MVRHDALLEPCEFVLFFHERRSAILPSISRTGFPRFYSRKTVIDSRESSRVIHLRFWKESKKQNVLLICRSFDHLL